jgi:hypothetical protein
MTSDQQPVVVLLCSDLMMTSSVGSAATTAGFQFTSTSRPDEAIALATSDASLKLLIDFSCPGLDIAAFAEALPDTVRSNAVAYGPHVHTAKIAAARAAGIGNVTSRGNFAGNLQECLASD